MYEKSLILVTYRHLQCWSLEPNIVIHLLWPLNGSHIALIHLQTRVANQFEEEDNALIIG